MRVRPIGRGPPGRAGAPVEPQASRTARGASTLSFFWIRPIGLSDALAQERDRTPAWAGNEKRE
jgi:hypothetical protein